MRSSNPFLFACSLIILFVVGLCGCAALDDYATDNPNVPEQVQAGVQYAGTLFAPFTGGLSSLIAGIVGAIVPAGLAINRHIVAHNRAKALAKQEAELKAQQLAAKAVVQSIDAAAAAGNGTIDLNNPNTKALLDAVQRADGKALVDQYQLTV